MGYAIAVRLAEEGTDVVVSDLTANARGNWGGLPAVVAHIEGMGRRAMWVEADVTDSDQVANMVQQALDRFGRIDILVNNAGAPAGPDRVPVVELDEAVFDRVLAVNVKGTFLCSKAVVAHMMDRGEGGKIINMSSTSGLKGSARFAVYCASKFAIRGFTQSLAHEVARYGIRVNAICPGLIETERVFGMASGLKPDGVSTEDFREQMIQRSNQTTPTGRIGQAIDVARTAAFLASEESDHITGSAISVSGGAFMY
ncbi:MAG: SDR family oxidoreductase [bacterium]|nr:SDR family oxidoreductase [bacterium]